MQSERDNYRFFEETLERNGVSAQSIQQLLVDAWVEETLSLATAYLHFANDESSADDHLQKH